VKFLLTIFFFLLNLICYSQFGKIKGQVIDTTGLLKNDPVRVTLMRDSVELKSFYVVGEGKFIFEGLDAGIYKVIVQRTGYRKQIRDKIILSADKEIELSIKYPSCLFHYNANYKPHCPLDSTDKFIPIVYGFPSNKMMKKSRKGKILLGGCQVSDCDPRYYCPIHKTEF
jgi:hypothetical protein